MSAYRGTCTSPTCLSGNGTNQSQCRTEKRIKLKIKRNLFYSQEPWTQMTGRSENVEKGFDNKESQPCIAGD